jgi:hypothetical protein
LWSLEIDQRLVYQGVTVISNNIKPSNNFKQLFIMTKPLIPLICFLCLLAISGCAIRLPSVSPAMPPPDHSEWDVLLKKHVNAEGFVRYKNFIADSASLNRYLARLSAAHPQKSWSREEQMAYWINAYNAFTVKLIVDAYPVASIKDIKSGIPFVNTVWDLKFINIQGQIYDLNNIEHGILRPQFKDARIHAAVNCASWSCPKLCNEAFTAGRLETQLEDAMRLFVNDPQRNRITDNKAELSAIFNWFAGDFKRQSGSVRAFVNRYAEVKIGNDTPVSHLDYDWRLNEESL